MINNREKGKLRLSLKKEEILGRTDTTITDWEGIIQSSQGQITIKYWGCIPLGFGQGNLLKFWNILLLLLREGLMY